MIYDHLKGIKKTIKMGNPSYIDDREIKITNEGRILVDSKNTRNTSFFR